MTLQGYVRLTEDIDLLVASEEANLSALIRALSGFGEGYAAELAVEDFTNEEGAIRIVEETEQSQIDLFTVMSGKRYDDVIRDVDSFQLGKHTIPVASKASLIGWKEASVREKDRLDAMALRRLAEDPSFFDT